MRNRSIVRPHALGSLGFHAHAICRDPQQFTHVGPNGGSVRANFGCRHNQGRIHIDDSIASRSHSLDCLRQETSRVGALPARVRGRKQRANIGGGDPAQQGVRDGVQEHVPVRVPAQPLRIRQGKPANLQRNAALEFVRIPAVADASFWFQGFQSGRWSFVVGRKSVAAFTVSERTPPIPYPPAS
jgi:hypothetical protein